MAKTLISQNQFKITPWKNGSGVSAEIAISPKDTDFRDGNFKWRISSARIEDETEFSKFPGYSRILTVLSGEGLILNDQEVAPFEVFEFEGEEHIECVPLSGPVEDLNVIFLRDRYRCSMKLLHITNEKEFLIEGGIHFFLPLSSPVNINGTEFEAPDFLKIEGAPSAHISATEYPATLLQILIWEDSVIQ